MLRATAAGLRRKRDRLRVRALGVVAVAVGASLMSAGPASAFVFAVPGVAFPETVTVGDTFPAGVALSNFSTPPQSTTDPILYWSDIDLYPACTNTTVDCPGGIDAGVYQTPTGTGTGAGDASCTGTWTISEPTPGRFRLTPPGGNGTVGTATGQTCNVFFSMIVRRLPAVDSEGGAAGIQTRSVVSATFTGTSAVGLVRNSSNQTTTVFPAPPVPPADFDGDGSTDRSVFRPSNSVWYSGSSSVPWGAAGDIPVPGDYDFDGITDRAVYRPASGVWYVARSSGGATSTGWGQSGDIPVPGDYDADGKTDQAVFRPSSGVWYVLRSAGGVTSTAWGAGGDIPVPGDYDGDGRTDQAVFRPASGVWFVQRTSGARPRPRGV